MSGARSRRKGERGERELARVLTAEGFPATRGQQHRGGPDSPDVTVPSLPGIHFEAKRTERLSLYDAIAQARQDAGDRLPIVAHRRNHCEWLAILPLVDLLTIIRDSDLVQSWMDEVT
jgi:Holliday junction resolvase